tara:strand:- start:529 stop:744 length:216 start_codon:yes stop_codon:yes gene_type:complete
MTKEDYSSHDWRKNTDSAVVVDDKVEHKALKVNDSRVIFINPNTLKEETVDVSRLIQVFLNNGEGNKKSIK